MQNYGGTLTWKMVSYEVASGTCGDDVRWVFTDNGILTISGTGAMWDKSCTWPRYCEEITKVVIEEGVTHIGEAAFSQHENLEEVIIADSVATIGTGAFYYCENLYSVELGRGVTSIGDEAFYHCTGLEKIVLPNNGTALGSVAFAYCTNLKEILILGTPAAAYATDVFSNVSATVYYISEDWGHISSIFGEDLTWVKITDYGTCGDELNWHLSGNVLTIYGTGAMYHYNRAPWFGYAEQITQVIVEEGVTSVGGSAFENCTELTTVTLPESLTIIATYAFQNCSKLISLEIPENVTAINAYTFQNCYALEKVTIPTGVTSISERAFRNCDALTEVTIPASVESISTYAFGSCDNLEEITFLGDAPDFSSNAFSNVTATCYYPVDNDTWTSAVMQHYGGTLTWQAKEQDVMSGVCGTDLTWALDEDGVLTISGTGAMYDYHWLDNPAPWTMTPVRQVVFSEDCEITYIGEQAFYPCRELKEITIPDTVTRIGYMAFYDCGALISVVLPDELKEIGAQVFYGCYALQEITIPENVESIGAFALAFSGLTRVNFLGNAPVMGRDVFGGLEVTCYYPANNETWIEDTLQDYGATEISWVAYGEEQDNEAPTFNTFFGGLSVSGRNFGGTDTSVLLGVAANDNVGVAYVKLEYSLGDAYFLIVDLTDANPGPVFGSIYTWDVSGLPSGNYIIRATAYDTSGNASDPDTESITVDNTPPEIQSWDVTAEGNVVTLTWDCSDETATFNVLRGETPGNEENYDILAQPDSPGYTDKVKDGTYFYYLISHDPQGNRSVTPVKPVTVDTAAPVLTVNPSADYGASVRGEITFTVSASDALGIKALKASYAGQTEDISEKLTINTAGLPDGVLEVVFTAEDNSGKTTEVTYLYTVDNTPPSAPGNLTVMAGQMKNTLSWSRSTEVGTTTKIYRALSEEGERVCIASIVEYDAVYNAFVDTDVVPGTRYYYWITAADQVGNESNWEGFVSAVPEVDTTAPEITSVTPPNGATLTGTAIFRITATDNIQVKSIALACSADGESWTDIDTVETRDTAQFSVNTTAYAGEKLYIQLTVEDVSGNQLLNSTTYSYAVDNTAPEQVSGLTAAVSATTITLNWNDVAAQDFAYFVVEQLVDGSTIQVETVRDALGVYLTGLEPDTTYAYRVYAVDRYGNKGEPSEWLTVMTVSDTTAPVISAISPAPGRYHASIPMVFTVSDNQGVQNISVQTSYDGEVWVEYAKVEVWKVGTSVSVPYTLDASALEEGLLYVRAVPVDLSGNQGDSSAAAPYCQYVIDRTAPAAPVGLKAAAGDGSITLTWEQGSEQDLSTYTVYRAEQEDGDYLVIASGLNQLYWVDSGLDYGAVFYYQIEVIDQAGNRSETSETISCMVLQDEMQPQVVSVSPSDGFVLGASTAIQVKVWDNNLVSTLYYQISTDGGETWGEVASVAVHATEKVLRLPVIQQELEDDFRMKFWCVDASGLVSESVYRSYALDKTAPAAPDVAVVLSKQELAIELAWTGNAEEDLAGYRIYRAEQGGSYRLLNQKTGGAVDYAYTDRTVEAGKTYSYYIEAVDVRGNTSKGAVAHCAVPVDVGERDQTAPVAVLDGSSVGATGYEIVFHAGRSYDNVGVTAYHWDFGDGTTAETAQVHHAFHASGSYTVKLMVFDAAGNTDTQTLTVTVRAPQALGTLTITVQDENGQTVKNAGVYVDLGREDMSVVYTGADGSAQVRVASGSHVIGVYKDGYLPAQKTVEVAAGGLIQMTVSIVEREIVVGELTVERMTLEQIRDAGIDVSDPANQDVYEFNIQLTYGTYAYMVSGAYNGDGQVLRDPEIIEIHEEDEIRQLVVRVYPMIVGDGNGDGSGNGNGNGKPENAEVPMVVIMDIPGTASWLKDFFDVRLTVINQANAEFILDNCYAYLNVPTGLTLMETNRTSAEPQVDMGSIAGQNTATAEWILRGDKAGYYDLTADFSAVLRDFNAPIHAQFQTAEPFQVRQGDGLTLEVMVENAIVADTDGAIRVGLRNDHEEPYYLPNIALDEDLVNQVDHFKTNGRVILENADMEVLHNGETIWWDYIVPRENWDVLTERSDEDFYLLDAIVESLGGTTELQWEIEEVMPFTINGDLIVVTRLSKSGAESDISYVNIDKSNVLGGTVPSLAIRTYRQNKMTHAYEPCSMEITIKDEYIIKKGEDAAGNKVGEGGIKVKTDSNGYYCYEGYPLINLYNTTSYNIRISASRAKPVELPVVMRGASAATGLLTVYTYTGSGDEIRVLEGAEVTILEADGTNATGITDEDGKIVFKKVDQGQQEISITKDGYLPHRALVDVKDESEYSFRLYADTDPNSTRIVQVSNSLTEHTKGNQTVIPEGGITGTVMFTLKARFAEGETFECYHYRIKDKTGNIRETDTFKSDNGFWLDLTTLKAGDTLEFAVENTDGVLSAFTDSNLIVFEQPDFFNGLVYDLSKIQLGGSIDTSSAFKFDPFATLEALYVTGITEGVELEDDENGYQAAVLEYLNHYVFSNTKFTQSFPLTAKYDLSGKLTISVICGGSAKTTTTTGTAYGAGSSVSTPTASYSSTIEMSQETEAEHSMSGKLQLDFVFQYDAPKDDWTLTVYLGASATQKLFDKDITFVKIIYVAGEAELKESVKLEVARTNVGPGDVTKLLDNGLVPESFNAEGEVKASVGFAAGKKDLASVGVYAKSGLEFQFLPYLSLTAKTAVGTEGNVLLWKKEKDLVTGEWEISDDTSVASLASLALYDLRSRNEDTLCLAECADVYAGWQGDAGSERWITGAYAGVDVQLVTLKDESVLAVWCDYTGSAAEPVALYWSVYDHGSWSEPARVDNDGTPDLYPSLIATDTGAQLVWVDFTDSVEGMNELTYAEIQKQAFTMLGVTTAAYTANGEWSSATSVTAGGLAAMPRAAAGKDGSVLVSWITNEAELEEATEDDPDSIGWMLLNEDGEMLDMGSIAAPYANLIDLGLGYDNGYQMSVLAEQQTGKQKLYYSEWTGDVWTELDTVSTVAGEDIALVMTTDGVAYTINSGRLYAYVDGQVYHLMHSDLLPESADGLTYAETEHGTVLLWNCMRGSDSVVCMVLVEDLTHTSQPVVVGYTADGILSAPAAAASGSNLIVMFRRAYIHGDQWCMDVETRSIPMGVDLSLESSLIQHSSHLVPGLALETYIAVDNLGAVMPDSFEAEIYTVQDGMEKVIARNTGSSSLNVTLQWTVPANYAGEPIYLRVVLDEDCNVRNNTVKLNNLVRELAVSGAAYVGQLDDKDIFTVDVENHGLVASEETVLQVRVLGTDDVLFVQEIATMNAGETRTVRLELDALDRTEEQPLIFTLIPVIGEEDESNNNDYLILPIERAVHICEGTLITGQAAACTVDGWKDYYQCSCSKLYEEKDCVTEIVDLESWKVGEGKIAAGHAYGELIEAVAAVHNQTTLTPAVAAHYQCSVCKIYFTESKVETTLETLTGEVPAHNYSASSCEAPATCSVCGATSGDALGHIDADTNHICDRNCGKSDMGDCTDIATDQDHVCDYGCGKILEPCADAEGDNNHSCDICGEIVTQCADENPKDHKCDECGALVSDHAYGQPTFIWSGDLSSVTVSVSCECGDAVTEACKVSYVSENDALIICAAASINGMEVSDTKVLKIEDGKLILPEGVLQNRIIIVAAYHADGQMSGAQILDETLEITVTGNTIKVFFLNENHMPILPYIEG